MNYPLAEAILGFAGGARWISRSSDAHREYGAALRALDGPGVRGRVMDLLAAYDPDVVAVQLNLLGSHDAPRMRSRAGWRRRRRFASRPCSRRRSRERHASTTGTRSVSPAANDPGRAARSRGIGRRWEPGLHELVRALAPSPVGRAGTPRQATLRVAGAAGGAVAFERGAGCGALRGRRRTRATKPGRSAAALRGSRGGCRRASTAIAAPGCGADAGRADHRRAGDAPPRAGSNAACVLRVG